MSDELHDHAIEAIQKVLSKGGFLHLSRLEVREDMLGKGVDVHLMQAVVSLLGEKYQLCLMTVEAFPLQFEWAATSDSSSVPYLTRSEEHTSELQSLMLISYAVFCLKKKKK